MTTPPTRPDRRWPSALPPLPARFWEVAYNGAAIPGRAEPGPSSGANCQAFAYAVLAHYGLVVPPLRSSELWSDEVHTVHVDQPEPLDLVLFNHSSDSWGAHVGVYLHDSQVLHLCKAVGHPAVWPLNRFAAEPRYHILLGAKRVTQRTESAKP